MDAPSTKQKIRLTGEQETLMITLYSKATGCPRALLDDEPARQVMAGVEYDFSKLNIKTGTRLTVCMRASKMDEYARDFTFRYPYCRVIHLGCGLDGRYQRVKPFEAEWYDLDLPEVIDLRRKFFPETGLYHLIGASATDPAWIELLPHDGLPVMVIAEGLMMYLTEEEVRSLVLRIQAAFPVSELVFDAFSQLTVRRIHRAQVMRKTGAQIHWGIDDPQEITRWGEGIRFVEEWFFNQAPGIRYLPVWQRMMFALAGKFPAAMRAHRILHYAL